jgi:hypothetical protein
MLQTAMLIGGLALSTTAGAQDRPIAKQSGLQVRYGPASILGDGSVRTYLISEEGGKPAELGVAISEAAMATVPDLANKPPTESFLTIDLAFPEGAPAPFRLMGFLWRPMGHPPVQIYGVPHFEFHFYLIDKATRDAIVPGPSDVPSATGAFTSGRFAERASRAPAAGYVPETYAYSPGSAVPMMGGHWSDLQSHEFHGQPFDRTVVYGTWDGNVIFIQAMITRAFIQSTPQGTYDLPATKKVPAPGWYPSAYTVKYDAKAKEYRVGLVGFAERQ